MTYEELKRTIEGLDEESRFFARPLFEAIEQDPKNPQPYLRLSEIFWKAGHSEVAYEVLQMLLDIDPMNETAKSKLETLEGFGVKPSDIAGEAKAKTDEKKTEMIVRAVEIGLAVIAVLFVALIIKWIFFKSTYKIDKGRDNFIEARFAPDGKSIAYIRNQYFGLGDMFDRLGGTDWSIEAKLIVSDLRGKDKKVVLEFPSFPFFRPTFAWLDNNRLAIGEHKGRHNEIAAIDIDSGNKNIIASGWNIWASPDGKRFCYIIRSEGRFSFNEDLMLSDPGGNDRMIDSGSIQEVAISNNGDVVVYSKYKHAELNTGLYGLPGQETAITQSSKQVFAYFRDTGRIIPLSDKSRYTCCVAVAPDGSKAAYIYSGPEEGQQLVVNDFGSGETVIFETSSDFPWVGDPVFSPDGRYLVFEAAMARSMEVREELTVNLPKLEKRMKAAKQIPGGFGFSQWLALSDLFYVDLAQALPQAKRLEIKNHRFKTRASFHPSGKLIAFEVLNLDLNTKTWISKFKPK